ncbi:MAG: homing endonuclease associated repeat-containing protein [Planctomycetaceae bacterium]
MDFVLTPWNKGFSDDELLADLKRVAEALGKRTVRSEEYHDHSRFTARLLERRFGSWNNALEAAGLEISQRQNIPDIEFFENMEAVWCALGRQPRRHELVKPFSKIHGRTYEKRFGGWRKALEAFIAYANSDQVVATDSLPASKSVPDRRFPDLRLRFRVMSRDSFRCQACGRSPATTPNVVLHVDHVIPWSKNGKTTESNLRTLCDKCNLGKGDWTPPDAAADGGGV